MSDDEQRAFEALPHHAAACRLRRYDDAGKEPGANVPSLDSYRPLLESLLIS
jgi:predicted HD phosphohydrolase